MSSRFLVSSLVIAALLYASGAAAAGTSDEEGPVPSARRSEIDENALSLEPPASIRGASADLLRAARLQTTGKAVLATAFVFIAAGIVLIEVDPYATAVGAWGFGSVGLGLSAFITSAFVLGLTRPVHLRDHPSRRVHRLSFLTGRGLALGYGRAF